MEAPRFASITLSLDTRRYSEIRPEAREHKVFYLIDRLLSGEEVAEDALEHYGIRVSIRAALKPEIVE